MDYLAALPDELKIQILSYLSSFELFELKAVSQYIEKIADDRSLVQKISFYADYRLNTRHFDTLLSTTFKKEYITSLNINCCYWIPVSSLRKCVGQLQMLKCLYVLDTNFHLCFKDVVCLQKLQHLERLAISSRHASVDPKIIDHFPTNLTGLCLLLLAPLNVGFIHKLKCLVDLWLIYPENCCRPNIKEVTPMLPPIQKITVCANLFCSPSLKFSFKNVCTYSSRQIEYQACYEMVNGPSNDLHEQMKQSVDPSWVLYSNEIDCPPPFGVAESRRLALKETHLEEMEFSELNFRHTPLVCCHPQKMAKMHIMSSPKAKLLKKLSINTCLCAQEDNTNLTNYGEPLFKRHRTGVTNSLPNKSVLEKIADNLPLIEILEIWECRNGEYAGYIRNGALASISKFRNLTKLTLSGIPGHINCEFLLDVCKECKNLASLKISSYAQNNSMNHYLSEALPHARSLVDLRYKQPYLAIDRIFESLSSVKNSKLRRLVILTTHIEKLSVESLDTFLTNNPGLCLLYLYFAELPTTVVKDINSKLQKFRTSSEKIISVVNEAGFNKVDFVLPQVHFYEMIKQNTFVSNLDIFNGFK